MIGRFPILLAWQEIRGSLSHFRFFLLCIALGVGSLVGVGNFAANLSNLTLREARNLLAADLEIRLPQPFSEKEEETLAPFVNEGVQVVRITELLAMAAPPDGSSSQLVELKGIEGGYPFYGELRSEPEQKTGIPIGSDPKGILAQEGLLIRLNLKVGERVTLGEETFILRGILRKEPDRVTGLFSLGPRVLISQEGLRATNLVQPTSRVRYRYLLKVPSHLSLVETQERLSEVFENKRIRIRSFQDTQPRLERFLNNLSTYIGLVGLITLLVGGIGVAGSIRAYLIERQNTLAILKSLGTSSRELLLTYLIQTLILAILGSLLGIVMGFGLQALLLHQAADMLPAKVSLLENGRSITYSIGRALAMGILTAILFSLPPLLRIRSVSPARLFRREVEPSTQFSFTWGDRTLLAGIGLSLLGLAFWQAGSVQLGIWVTGALSFSILILFGAAHLFLFLIRRIPKSMRSLSLRQGLANLYRPGNQSRSIIISVGLGISVLLTLALVEASLMDHLRENLPDKAPSLFFIDIQPDQKRPFEQLMSEWPLENPARSTPLVRSRLHAIDGQNVSEMDITDRANGWYYTREYVLTEQAELPDHNRILRGRWWESDEVQGGPLLSVEAEAARHLGLRLGSSLTFDVQGVQIEGKVESFREVDWGSFTTNFFMIFSPKTLSGAPTTYVAEVRTPPEIDLPLQTAVVRAFPNVTAIPLRDVLEGITQLLERMALVIRWLAVIALLAGLLVLSGALAATRFRRLREMAILKILGATRPYLLLTLATEYLLLGSLTGIVASLLSIPLAYSIVRFLLESPWTFHPERVLTGLIATAGLTLVTGLVGTWRSIGKKPLAVLRSE